MKICLSFNWKLSSEIVNSVNNLPLHLGMGNIVSNCENMDLLTPNRLKLERNTERKPISPMLVAVNLSEIMTMNERIFNTWFEMGFMSHVLKLMHEPQWFHSDCDIKVCDIALFIRHDNTIASKNNSQ